MFQIEDYLCRLIAILKKVFEKRLLYVGLQGSYLRDEATESSDIDVMVILDNMSAADLWEYRQALMQVGDFEKSCGFICGRKEMTNWNPPEICHLLHTTKDYYGCLADYVPSYTKEDTRNYVKLSLNNLFHELCHRYIHSDRERNIAALPITCKQIFFILQNIHYLDSGYFAATKQELLQCVQGEDREILELALSLASKQEYDFDSAFEKVFAWCQNAMVRI